MKLYKRIIQIFLLVSLVLGGTVSFLPKKRPIMPVVLLIWEYPLSKPYKDFLAEVNPYGFLLSIPTHKGMDPVQLKKELEDVLGRKDFIFFIDQEGGSVNRIKQFDPSFKTPHAEYFGKLAKKDLNKAVQEVKNIGLVTGKKLKELAMDVVFAPVAEPAIQQDVYGRGRYFSEDPKIAKILADAYAEGLASGGVTPCYKHFPGASTTLDPHIGASVFDENIELLKENSIQNFSKANDWNCIMTSHGIYNALDKKNVSTYSGKFYQFLRKELHYEGLIIPDALNMEAADGSNRETLGFRMNKALEAGADVVLPFFNTMDFETNRKQLSYIQKKYIKRFQKKLSLLKRIN